MAEKICCPNCGYPNLFLVVTETTEKTYRLSLDGVWMSRPVSDEYGKFASHDTPKILSSKATLFCQFCGQENDAVLDTKDILRIHFSMGQEISHGASVVTKE